MKKKICIILIPLLIISMALPFHGVIADRTGQSTTKPAMSKAEKLAMREEVLETMNTLSQMYEKYDAQYSDEFVNSDSEIMEIKNRLVIKADDVADDYNAIDSAYGFGYAFLQYADEESAEAAYNNFKELGYKPAYDAMLKPQADDIQTGTNGEAMWKTDWAYTQTDVDAMLDYYKLKIKKKVVVAILDSGVNYNHELVKSRVVRTNFNAVTSSSDDEMDDNGHGTMLAGVITKSTPTNVKIESYKIADRNATAYGSALDAALSYFYFSDTKPDIVNISYYDCTSLYYIDELVGLLSDDGVTFVLSSGNESKFVSDTNYIAYGRQLKEKKVISVAGINPELKNFNSDYGPFIDLSAPGYKVYTSELEAQHYALISGTSMAAAFVSAAAAVVLTDNSNYSPEQVKSALTDAVIPFKKDSNTSLIGAGIVNFSNLIDGSRAKPVTANYPEGIYREDISVELKCANTLVDIYYTTDGSLPTKSNGIKYESPINLSESTRIIAAAYARVGTTLHSKFLSLDYYILKNGESGYKIRDDGEIYQYFGTETDLTIPDVIDGIVPVSISESCFRYKSVENIVLPDSINRIEMNAFYQSPLKSITANGLKVIGIECFEGSALEKADLPKARSASYYAFKDTPIAYANLPELWSLACGAFYNCTNLSNINIPEVEYIYENTFYNCVSLTSDLVLPKITKVYDYGFANSYFNSITLPNCISANAYAFNGAAAKRIELKQAETIGACQFADCTNLEFLYLPLVRGIDSESLKNCTSLKILFAPLIQSIPLVPSDAVLYLGAYAQCYYSKSDVTNNCTIVAPYDSLTNGTVDKTEQNFIAVEDLYFNGINGEDCVYTNSQTGENVTLPLRIVVDMWNSGLINSIPDNHEFVNRLVYTFMLDFTNDDVVNAKDYAEMQRYLKIVNNS